MSNAQSKVSVQQDADNPVEKTVLAQAIVDISRAAKRLSDSGLNRRAIEILLHHESRIPLRDIKTTLDCLKNLEKVYCK